jgi:hypothetical protein
VNRCRSEAQSTVAACTHTTGWAVMARATIRSRSRVGARLLQFLQLARVVGSCWAAAHVNRVSARRHGAATRPAYEGERFTTLINEEQHLPLANPAFEGCGTVARAVWR